MLLMLRPLRPCRPKSSRKEAELGFIRAMIGVNVENFESTLDLIDAQYGSLQAYLEKALGFTPEEQESMKRKYLRKNARFEVLK